MPLSPLCVFLGLYAWILRKTWRSVRPDAKIAIARTPRAAKHGHKAQWSAEAQSLATPDAGTLRRRPVPRKAYYPRYPAVDRLLDLLAENGIPASHISCDQTAGRYYLSVLLPGHRFTDQYEGADLQAVASRWLTGEADTFAEQCLMAAEQAA
jgi:hypothetical protein